MSCARTHRLLDAWIDDELDAATRDEIAQHLASCPSCAALRSERAELGESLRAAAGRYTAPPELAAAVRRRLARSGMALAIPRYRPSWWTVAAIACTAAFAGAFAMLNLLQATGGALPAEQAVDRHVAALAVAGGRAEGPVEVAASDRHAIKPWFQGKVDFAPPVPDLASEGFALLGARLDRVGGRSAGVVVYRIRNHTVDLFVWRADGAPASIHLMADRGFSVATWAEQGLRFAAVSDVDAKDLERFARALQPPQGTAMSP